MTTLLERHMVKMAAAAELEADVYRAWKAWAPAARDAAAARQKMLIADRRVVEAEREVGRILKEIEGRNPELARDLFRLHRAGNLNREAIGEGGDRWIKGVLDAEKAVLKAREDAREAKDRSAGSGGASSTANALFADVLRALDALRQSVTPEVYQSVVRVFSEGNKSNPDTVADACKTRLETLGAK